MILRSGGCGVGAAEQMEGACSGMPCAYFEGKNREMKAKKERGGIIIPKGEFKEFVEFQKCFTWKNRKTFIYPYLIA